jgi:hypothetical protein
MKKFIFVILLFGFLNFSCKSNSNSIPQNDSSVSLKLKITNLLPIGWGYKYSAQILEGNTKKFKDSIIFGVVVGSKFEFLNVGDTCKITFYNTHEKNEKEYLPAVTGAESITGEIWLIGDIIKLNSNNQEFVYIGRAVNLNGRASFIWDFADSESFLVEGVEIWDEKYLNKKLSIQGILKQYYYGAVITNSKIIKIE